MFCSEWGTDPVHATVETVLEFLTELYKSGIGYSAINTARSALSAIVNLPDKSPVGQHPLVRRFLKGVFQSRPTTPRYNTTWDVNIVLDYLKSLFPVNDITLKHLTLKVVMLTILVTGQRSQTIHLMDIKNMQVLQDRYIFTIASHTKTAAPGRKHPSLVLPAFPADEKLCVVTCLREYLRRTELFRDGSSSSDCLWVSFVKPHKAISKDTISRWIRNVMKEAGIDTKLFKPHSTRAASTSAAKLNNVDIDTIMDTAGWSNANTFAKFYDRQISQDGVFAAAVLKNHQ